jgi:hypothetical protein
MKFSADVQNSCQPRTAKFGISQVDSVLAIDYLN